ncbi:MAG TPA: hypothetical protein VJH24_04540 [Candidatus Bilamarchaeaceae archaeon]|nr:hypothetical protein [Candidatus Bilamarchaeaceae archaeon]
MNVVSTKAVGVGTVKKILGERAKDEELGYEQQQSLEHAEKFAQLDEKATAKLVEDLCKVEKLTEETAFKIADVLPRQPETLAAILVKDKVDLTEEELRNVLGILQKTSK